MSFRPFLKFVLLLTGVGAVMIGLGMVVTRKLGGSEAVTGMLWGCGLSWLAALIGGLPQVFIRSSPQNSGVLVLGSTAIRMVVTLGGVLVIALATDVARVSFLLWVALSYFIFLGADVFYVLRPKSSE